MLKFMVPEQDQALEWPISIGHFFLPKLPPNLFRSLDKTGKTEGSYHGSTLSALFTGAADLLSCHDVCVHGWPGIDRRAAKRVVNMR